MGNAGVPTAERIPPTPSRISWSRGALRPPAGGRGVMRTRSAPAPRSARLFVIVSALVPTPPEPSAYVPGQIAIVSPGVARSIASWILANGAAGQSRPSSSTDKVAAEAVGAAISAPKTSSSEPSARLPTVPSVRMCLLRGVGGEGAQSIPPGRFCQAPRSGGTSVLRREPLAGSPHAEPAVAVGRELEPVAQRVGVELILVEEVDERAPRLHLDPRAAGSAGEVVQGDDGRAVPLGAQREHGRVVLGGERPGAPPELGGLAPAADQALHPVEQRVV